jgi:hypothetical protein
MRLLIGTLLLALSVAAGADVWVNGYNLNNGTYVQPHARSDPNGTTRDNYSTRGNVNPYTAERGYRSDDGYPSNDGWPSQRPYGGTRW